MLTWRRLPAAPPAKAACCTSGPAWTARAIRSKNVRGGVFTSIGWVAKDLPGAVSNREYLPWVVAPDPGYVIAVESLSFFGISQNKARNAALMSSAKDVFWAGAAPLAAVSLPATGVEGDMLRTVDLTAVEEMRYIDHPVEFRLYIFSEAGSIYEEIGIGSTSGSAVRDLALTGTTTPAAEVRYPPHGLAMDSVGVRGGVPAGTAVGNLLTFDRNTNDVFTYALVAGEGDADNAAFSISNNELLTAAVFDPAVREHYSVCVRTTDSTADSLEKPFAIRVYDAAQGVPVSLAMSEFMADNETVWPDEDVDFHDWIEIWNNGTEQVDLNGWYLTDSRGNLK